MYELVNVSTKPCIAMVFVKYYYFPVLCYVELDNAACVYFQPNLVQIRFVKTLQTVTLETHTRLDYMD